MKFQFKTLLFVIIFSLMLCGCDEKQLLSEDDTVYVGNFSLSDYIYELEKFAASIKVDPITNYQEAIDCARDIWKNRYNWESVGLKCRVFYDDTNQAWLVCDTLPEDVEMDGGVPYMLIDAKENMVIAVWHTK